MKPTCYVPSLIAIHPKTLLQKGIRLVIVDMDNTLCKPKENKVTKEAKTFIENLKQHNIQVCVLSNNFNICGKAKQLSIPCFPFACKPLRLPYLRILKKFRVKTNQAMVIGDQLFSDILGGNRMGMTTVLVDALTKDDHLFGKLTRSLGKLLKHCGIETIEQGEYYGNL